MSLSDNTSLLKKAAFICLGFTGFFILFTVIYYQFSHDVESNYMTFLALVPFSLGFLPAFFLIWRGLPTPGFVSYHSYFSGVAAITMSCCLRGIFEIAGNSSVYQVYLFYFGLVVAIIGLLAYVQMFFTGKEI